MKKILNPFVSREGYNCFGCSPDNPIGLKLKFEIDGEFVIAEWQPEPQFQGWNNTLHGGIQATLLDELASWLVFVKLDTSGVTSKMEVKLRKPVTTNQGTLYLKGKLREMQRNIAVIDTWLYNHEMVLCTEAVMYYFTFPQDVARDKFWYPGTEAFTGNNAD
jgi:acyl-coenzyme A thioesterase PaaI-like protein